MSGLPRRKGLSLLVVPLLLIPAVGCGGGAGNISGEVKVGGEPLKEGTIAFVTQARKKKIVTGAVTDGKYSVSGVPLGEVLVTVQSLSPTPAETLNPAANPPPAKPKAKKPDP